MGPLDLLQVQIAYYAGLFDGEGSVYIAKQYKRSDGLCLVVSIAMTDTVALKSLVRDFGGCLSTCGRMPKPSHHKQPYKWTVKSQKAITFLRTIRPYTLVESEQIDVAFEFQNRIDTSELTRGRGYKLPVGEKSIRMELRVRLHELKKVSVHGVASGIAAKSGNGANPNPEPSKPDLFPGWACVETMGRRQSLLSESQEIVQSDRN